MSAEPRFAAHPDAVFTLLDPEHATILHLGSKRYYTLNDTGVRIWQLLERHGTVEAVACALTAEFEIELEPARRRVASFLAELRADGLVEARDAR